VLPPRELVAGSKRSRGAGGDVKIDVPKATHSKADESLQLRGGEPQLKREETLFSPISAESGFDACAGWSEKEEWRTGHGALASVVSPHEDRQAATERHEVLALECPHVHEPNPGELNHDPLRGWRGSGQGDGSP